MYWVCLRVKYWVSENMPSMYTSDILETTIGRLRICHVCVGFAQRLKIEF